MHIYVDGGFYGKDEAKISVFDHGLLYGDGVFEGIRVYNGRVFELEAHIDRLYASAQAIALELPISRPELVEAMMETIRRNDVRDGYVRLVVTRGIGDLGLNPAKCPEASMFCIAGGITLYPAEVYQRGFKVVTLATRRNDPQAINPAIKSLNYLNNVIGALELRGREVNEGLFLTTAGYVCECTADNFFLVKGRQAHDAQHGSRRAAGHHPGSGHAAGRRHGPGGGGGLLHPPRRLQRRRGLPHRHGGRGGTGGGGRQAAHRRGSSRSDDQGHHRSVPRVRAQHRHGGRSRELSPPRALGILRHQHEMSTPADILLYDTTLRDGMQREGLSVSVDEKVRIALRIADLGIHVIEGGFPGSNPKDEEFFRRMEKEPLGAPRSWRPSA